ncbi:MAG TPA: EamA family transporter [Ktedonobacterales bacterium]
MTLPLIGLLIFAGLLNATGNLLTKRSGDKRAFLWLVYASMAVLFAVPFALVFHPFPAQAWPFILLSGALEATYALLLSQAYSLGDFSLVYPLARGSAPIFAALLGVSLLGDRLAPVGVAGISLVVAGVYVLHVPAMTRAGLLAPLRAIGSGVSRLAILIGLIIGSYSTVDKLGVRLVPPWLFIYMITVVSALLQAPVVLLTRRAAVARELRTSWGSIITASLILFAPFLLVLIALQHSQVSYVASVRECSVVFGAALGALVLREPFGRVRVAGAVIVFAGIVCIAVAG